MSIASLKLYPAATLTKDVQLERPAVAMIKAMAAGPTFNALIFFIATSCLEYRDGLAIGPLDPQCC
jgi:hypothetical protein